ncbi:hypothetical protein NPIL_244761, partial [Nephila pilipes]
AGLLEGWDQVLHVENIVWLRSGYPKSIRRSGLPIVKEDDL